MQELLDRVAVVTGASEGIGEAIVRQLAAQGMKVAALARRGDKLVELETELKSKGQMVKGYKCDVVSESNVRATFKSIYKDLGPVTVLINNAGASKISIIKDMSMEDVNTVINTNIVGVISCTKEAVALMEAHSVDHGHIININSVAGQREPRFEGASVYAASKKASVALTYSLRKELMKSNIRVTSISPAVVKTTMAKHLTDKNPTLPYMFPSDIADAVMFALSAPLRMNVSEIILDNTGQ